MHYRTKTIPRIMAIRVPLGGGRPNGSVAVDLARRFAARDALHHAPAADAAAPSFESVEPRLLLAATQIAFVGSSSVEGIVGSNSFRRPLWKQLTAAGYDVNFVGSKNTNQSGSTPPNADFDRDNDGRSGWEAQDFLNGRSGVPKLADLLTGNSSDGVAFTPDIAVIYVGHNDIFNPRGQTDSQNAAATASEISQIIDVLRADNPNVTIVLGLLHNTAWSSPGYKTVSNPNPNAGIADLNGRLATLAQDKNTSTSRVVTADINTGFDPFDSSMTLDGQHATATGEQFMADRFFAVIEKFLPGNVIVTPTSGSGDLATTETGGKAFFSVSLSKKPTDDVTIHLSVSDTSEGSINKTTLTFTSQNWDQAQSVAITGVDDSIRDGDKPYTINLSNTQSNDPNFDGLSVPNVSVTNIDNEGAITGSAFIDLDKDGVKDGNEVALANVTVFLDLNHNGLINAGEPTRTTNSSGEYTFDNLSSGTYVVRVAPPEGYTVSPQGKSSYSFDIGGGQIETGIFALAVEPGQVIVTPTSGLQTTEGGGQASFSVRLSKAPSSNVTVTLSVSDASEGTLSTTSLTFTSSNWNTPQVVTVTGVNDTVLDGHKAYTVVTSQASSSDPAYNGVDVADVSLTNLDNESAVAGTVYFDANGNGTRDSGETLLSGVTVFLDANANGSLDSGEAAVTTDSQGRYSFSPLLAGAQNVRVIAPAGHVSPVGNGAAVILPAGTTATRDFALVKPSDTAGDTPATARNLGNLATPQQTIDEYLTAEDRADLYRIRIRKNAKLKVLLNGLDADARLQLLDKSGHRVRNISGVRALNHKITAAGLKQGVYFIRVVSRDGLDTPYRLRVVNK